LSPIIGFVYDEYLLPLTQRQNANIQNLIQSIGLDSLSAEQISLMPPKNKGSLKRVKSTAATINSEVEVSKLSSEDFMAWLMRKGYSIQDCQAFRGRCQSIKFKQQKQSYIISRNYIANRIAI